MLIRYNLMAAAGAAIGMLNTVLTWKLFGATQAADIWLLGLAVSSVLGLLVLLGVEQFLVFYTNVLIKTPGEAAGFATAAVAWALLSGTLFALGCFGVSDMLVSWFAGGLDFDVKQSAAIVLALLLPQVGVAPLLHVVRGLLNAHGRYGWSYSLSLIAPSTLLTALFLFIVTGEGGVRELGWAATMAAIFQLLACFIVAYVWCGKLPERPIEKLSEFVKNSVTMRMGHSFHNFFVGMIINNVLSHQATGMIAIFQYAKRFADGVFTVTVGPHLNIFLARQAAAWAEYSGLQHRQNIRAYFRVISPLYIGTALAVFFLMPWLLHMLGARGTASSVTEIQMTYSVFALWQALIAAEAVFVSVVMTARRSFVLWGVNGLFIASFYLYTTFLPAGSPVWWLVMVALVAQLISFLCYGLVARYFAKRRFVDQE